MNKRALILFVSLFIIAAILILNGSVFVIRNIEIVDKYNEGISTEEIINSSGIIIGKNIFTLNESIVASNIEATDSTIKVVMVERIFPSNVKITIAKRVPTLAIYNGTSYDICDFIATKTGDGIALNDYDIDITVISKGATIIDVGELTIINGLYGEETTLSEPFSTTDNGADKLKDIILTFKLLGIEDNNFSHSLKSINMQVIGSTIEIKMRSNYNNGSLLRFDGSMDIACKVQSLVSFYNDIQNNNYRTNYILTAEGEKINGAYSIITYPIN